MSEYLNYTVRFQSMIWNFLSPCIIHIIQCILQFITHDYGALQSHFQVCQSSPDQCQYFLHSVNKIAEFASSILH